MHTKYVICRSASHLASSTLSSRRLRRSRRARDRLVRRAVTHFISVPEATPELPAFVEIYVHTLFSSFLQLVDWLWLAHMLRAINLLLLHVKATTVSSVLTGIALLVGAGHANVGVNIINMLFGKPSCTTCWASCCSCCTSCSCRSTAA